MKTTVLSSTAIAQVAAQVAAIPNQATRTTTGKLSGFAAAAAVMVTGDNYEPFKPLIQAIDAKIDKHGAGNTKWAKDFGKAIDSARKHQGNGHDRSHEHAQQA